MKHIESNRCWISFNKVSLWVPGFEVHRGMITRPVVKLLIEVQFNTGLIGAVVKAVRHWLGGTGFAAGTRQVFIGSVASDKATTSSSFLLTPDRNVL